MNAQRSNVSYAGQGWILILLLLSLAGFHFVPLIQEIVQNQGSIYESRTNSSKHVERLYEPVAPDRFARYRSFVYEPIGAQSIDQIKLRLQSELRDAIKPTGVLLKNMRNGENSESAIEGVEFIKFRLETEGDYIAVLGVLSALAKEQTPYLVDRVELEPVRQGVNADKRLRLVLELAVWVPEQAT